MQHVDATVLGRVPHEFVVVPILKQTEKKIITQDTGVIHWPLDSSVLLLSLPFQIDVAALWAEVGDVVF